MYEKLDFIVCWECPLFVQALFNMAVGQEVYIPVALQHVVITVRTATDVARDGGAKWLNNPL
jgi:hypothetical protein